MYTSHTLENNAGLNTGLQQIGAYIENAKENVKQIFSFALADDQAAEKEELENRQKEEAEAEKARLQDAADAAQEEQERAEEAAKAKAQEQKNAEIEKARLE